MSKKDFVIVRVGDLVTPDLDQLKDTRHENIDLSNLRKNSGKYFQILSINISTGNPALLYHTGKNFNVHRIDCTKIGKYDAVLISIFIEGEEHIYGLGWFSPVDKIS